MDKYLDKFLTEYLDTKRVFLGSGDNLRNYCERTWLKDHGWNNITELYMYTTDKYNIPEKYLEYLTLSFIPVTEEFLNQEKDYLCARHKFETLNIEFDTFIKEENKDLIPACILKYKCPYCEEDSFSSVIDFEKHKYSINAISELSMTIFNLTEDTQWGSSPEKVSIILFKGLKDNPKVGVTHYPFNISKNIMYIETNNLKASNTLSVPIEDSILEHIKNWIALNRNTISKYWNDPNYSSEMLRDDIKLGGIHD